MPTKRSSEPTGRLILSGLTAFGYHGNNPAERKLGQTFTADLEDTLDTRKAAATDKTDLATSLILNSSLQVAIALTPALVLISRVIGGGALTLVLSPLLLGAVFLAALLAAVIVFDGESTWLEGLALLGLYLIIAASVWYGPPIHA